MKGLKKYLVQGVVGVTFCAMMFTMEEAKAETLQEAMGIAYLSNPTLLAARANLRRTDEGVSQARGGWRPTVEATGTAEILQRRSDNININETDTTYTGSISVTQNLYAGGGTEAEIKRSTSAVLAARARLRESEQQVLFAVAQAYMDVFRDTAVLELSQQNVARLRRQMEATSDRFQVGEVTRTDVAQAESRLASAVADMISAEGTLEVSRAGYVQLVGKSLDGASEPQFEVSLPTSLGAAVDLGREFNPTILAAREDLKTANHAVDVAFASLLPSLDVSASASSSREVVGVDEETNILRLVAQLSIPLYQQGIISSQIRQAKQSVAQAEHAIDEADRAIVENVTASWETLQTTIAQIQSINEEVRAAELALEGVEQEASVGARTVLDVLDAEQELLNAQVSLARSQRDETVARFSLLSSIGSLTASSLGLNIQLYDDSAYLNKVENKWWGFETE